MEPLRVGIVCDLREENWPSMDLVADMLTRHLHAAGNGAVNATLLRPTMTRRLTRLPILGGTKLAQHDRILNRFFDYPAWLRRLRDDFDIFHIVDHSYAHLVHALPSSRTVVTCHDVDAFLTLVAPNQSTSRLPKLLTRRILSGLRRAAHVACDSVATSNALTQYQIVPLDRVTVVHNGVHPCCSPLPNDAADRWLAGTIGASDARVDLLHVGSTIPRKRIDLLLRIVAAVRTTRPDVRLLKAGGSLTDDQRALARSLGLEAQIVSLPYMSPLQLAATYRHAALVLLPSEREGFGLPLVEAMACGTPVVVTDLPVLREVGGSAAVYCGLDEVARWLAAVLDLLRQRDDRARSAANRHAALKQASQFSWARHAHSMAAIYRKVWAETLASTSQAAQAFGPA